MHTNIFIKMFEPAQYTKCHLNKMLKIINEYGTACEADYAPDTGKKY